MSPLYEKFLPLLPPGSHILDAECGTGRESAEFLKRGFQVLAKAMVERAAKQSPSRSSTSPSTKGTPAAYPAGASSPITGDCSIRSINVERDGLVTVCLFKTGTGYNIAKLRRTSNGWQLIDVHEVVS